MRSLFCSLGLLAVLSTPAVAEVRLPALFSDHMVLQRDQPLPIWGWAEPGEEITLSLAGQTKTSRANADGKWTATLAPIKAGRNLTLTVKGKNTLTINDVLIGDVWLCSGQSNMAMTVARSNNFDAEKAAADLPDIRQFKVATAAFSTPQQECKGEWVVCSPESVGNFTAAGFFFGRAIHKELGVPVGLVNSSVGGTAIEAWTSADIQKDRPELKPVYAPWDRAAATYEAEGAKAAYEKRLATWKKAAAQARSEGKPVPRRPQPPVEPRLDRNHPANLYNGMIASLIPYALRGVLWYQGERNARTMETAALYRIQLPLLIRDWRTRWKQEDLPFFWAQLPNFKKRSDDPGAASEWALIRESMLRSLEVPHTGMAVTIDVGEANDIHPKNKQDVGKRLAQAALAQVYGKKAAGLSPLYASHKIEGDRVIIRFKNADVLEARGDELIGFAIAGEDHRWHWAKARIDGDRVIVSSTEVKTPVAVRYAWGDNPDCNLTNGAGLPASPFRTDSWDK